MRRWRCAGFAALVIALLTTAAPAVADRGIFIVTGTNGLVGANSAVGNVKVSGAVTVDFHGDAAAGCAAAHLCNAQGRVRWDPSGDGSIYAIGYRVGGRHFEEGSISIGDFGSENPRLRTSARVRLDGTPDGLCADGAAGDTFGADGPTRRGSTVELRMLALPGLSSATTDVLRTNCAGPMESDVASLLPAHRITERALIRGHRTLDFSADRPFSAHGLAGTMHSTVVMRVLGGQRYSGGGRLGRPPSVRHRRIRAIGVRYHVDRVSGQIATRVSGLSDPDLCGPLDACGVTGSVITAPAASSGTAEIAASASAKRPRRQLRVALGLASGRIARSISREGGIEWTRDAGDITSDLSRLGTPICSDAVPMTGGGIVNLSFAGRRVRATYDAGAGVGSDRLRTRCPGPGADDVPGALASGTFPLGMFRHPRVTLRLTKGRRFGSAGYSAGSAPDITVVLRRTGIHEVTYSEEIPSDFEQHVRSLR